MHKLLLGLHVVKRSLAYYDTNTAASFITKQSCCNWRDIDSAFSPLFPAGAHVDHIRHRNSRVLQLQQRISDLQNSGAQWPHAWRWHPMALSVPRWKRVFVSSSHVPAAHRQATSGWVTWHSFHNSWGRSNTGVALEVTFCMLLSSTWSK